jgi:hypothetical protein
LKSLSCSTRHLGHTQDLSDSVRHSFTPGSFEADLERDRPDPTVIGAHKLGTFRHFPQGSPGLIDFADRGRKKYRDRAEMPQIKGKYHQQFLDWLHKKHGIESKTAHILPSQLERFQRQILMSKAGSYLHDPKIAEYLENGSLTPDFLKDTKLFGKKIIVSRDNFIVDGHHHWFARKWLEENYPDRFSIPMEVWQIDAKIKKILRLADDFPKTTYQDVFERTIDDIRDLMGWD